MRIGILTEHDSASWSEQFLRGERSSPLPYGIDYLRSQGHLLDVVPAVPAPRQLRVKFDHRAGFPLFKGLNLPHIRRYDVVIALLETQAFAYANIRAYASSLGLPPLVTLECWLADDIVRADSAEQNKLVSRAARLGLILSLSKNQTSVLRAAGISNESTMTVPFAVSGDYFTPGVGDARAREILGDAQVVFVGQDRGRDFKTFLAAMAMLDGEVKAVMITQPHLLAGVAVPANVRVYGRVTAAEYRSLLQIAPVVAVPTFELTYPTGQSVALEAAVSGAPIVVTSTPAMREYIAPSDAEMPAVGDVAGLAQAIASTLVHRVRSAQRASALRSRVLKEFNRETMWKPVAEAIARG
ncbi:MAG: glycosyltransferase family 4 protein [Micrococcus sp.]|nr:glycosyltransferase family 4 protein [Micrococcus sp.]